MLSRCWSVVTVLASLHRNINRLPDCVPSAQPAGRPESLKCMPCGIIEPERGLNVTAQVRTSLLARADPSSFTGQYARLGTPLVSGEKESRSKLRFNAK